jgi:hypothetical protein
MDLSGAISRDGDPDLIESWDLYAGLFDGAEVEAWLVPWDGRAACGACSRAIRTGPADGTGFKVDLDRRRREADADAAGVPCCSPAAGGSSAIPVTCQKDLGPLTVAGRRARRDAATVHRRGSW